LDEFDVHIFYERYSKELSNAVKGLHLPQVFDGAGVPKMREKSPTSL